MTRLGGPLLKLRWWQEHDRRLSRLSEATGAVLELPMEAAHRLVRDGRATGFFPRTYIADDLERGTLLAVRVQGFTSLFRDSALVRRRRETPLGPAAAALVQALEAQATALGLERRSAPRR